MSSGRAQGYADTNLARSLADNIRQHGMTVGDYLCHLRVEFAIDQLASGSIALADLALAAGLCDHSHFCHVFKACIGATPAQFRAAARGK